MPRCEGVNELSRRAGSGIPAGSIGKLLEVCARDERRIDIHGIVDGCGHDEPRIAVWGLMAVEIFGHDRVRTVGNAVLAQVARADAIRYDFQVAAASRSLSTTSVLPLRHRIPLPARIARWRLCCTEVEQS